MTVHIEIEGHVLRMTLNRPEARNAIDGPTAEAMDAGFDRLENDRALRVGMVTGTGSAFSAGADLKAVMAGQGRTLMRPRTGFAGLVRRIRKKPLIAAVNGWALAGGFEIALACDIVVASKNAQFGLPEVARSLLPSAGGLIRLPRAIGLAPALDLLLTGDPISAQRAYELGLVTRVTEPEGLLGQAERLAQRIAENAPLAVQATRRLALRAFNESEEALFQAAFDEAKTLWASLDGQEGPQAFIEKRPPRWTGR